MNYRKAKSYVFKKLKEELSPDLHYHCNDHTKDVIESATRLVREGDLLIVDGNTGEVIINPDDEIIIEYQEKRVQHEEYKSSIARLSHLPAITLDGHAITVD